MTAISVAVWGLGPHSLKNILPALAGSSATRVAGVCSRNADTVARAASEFGCALWTDPSAMLGSPLVDAVFVSTPIGMHFSHGQRVLGAGKHLWCEKPLASSLKEAETLVGESRSRGLTIAEGFMFLYHPQFAHVSDMLAAGAVGEVRSVRCRFGIPALARPGFRRDPALGGGAFLDVGSYPIAALTSLFPEDPKVDFARLDMARGSPVDTSGEATLSYTNDVLATLDWGIGLSYRNEIDFWGSTGSMYTEKIFSKQTDYIPEFTYRDVEGRERQEKGVAANHFMTMFEAFREMSAEGGAAERERERERILRCASLTQRIRNQSEA